MSWWCQQLIGYNAIIEINTVWSILSLFMVWQYVKWDSLVNTMPVYDLLKSILTQFGQYHACLWTGEFNIDTVWSIPCLFTDWWSEYWHSLANTMPVNGLVKSILTQFGQYHACLWPGKVNIDTVWSIPCLFMVWWSQDWHNLVNTMPVYGLVKSMVTQFGWYHAGLGLGKVNIDTAWLIWCLFMDWWSQLMQFNHNCNACSWADEVNQHSLVNTELVYVMTMSTERVWSITSLFMFWRCLLTEFGQ